MFTETAEACSPASTIWLSSDTGTDNEALKETVERVNKIQDTTEAMLAQQDFYSTLDTNFANFVTAAVDRLQQHDDGNDVQVLPSEGWVDYNVQLSVGLMTTAKWALLNWQRGIRERVKEALRWLWKMYVLSVIGSCGVTIVTRLYVGGGRGRHSTVDVACHHTQRPLGDVGDASSVVLLQLDENVVESPQSPPPSDQCQQQQQPIPVIPLKNYDNTTTGIKLPIVLVPATSEQNYEIMDMDMDTCVVEIIISECERSGCCVEEVVNAVQAHCLERCISDVWRAGITWTTHRCMAPDSAC